MTQISIGLQTHHNCGLFSAAGCGQRFLMLRPVDQKDPPITEIHVVLNWGEKLKQLAPAHK